MKDKSIKIINRITIGVIILFSSLWSFWGIMENFHEGWYFSSLLNNLFLMLIQYLSPVIIITALAIVSIKKHKAGGILWISLWLGFSYFIFFGSNFPFTIKRFLIWLPLTLPLLLIGLSFYFYEIKDKKTALTLIIIIPLLIIFGLGIPNFIRVSKRFNDHDFGKRIVKGNGITLVWSPKGAGFPERGMNWFKAKEVCSHLNENGDKILNNTQNIWRLPTRDEIVRSLTRKNRNCKGVLTKEGKAFYRVTPDKETPLWNPNSIVIYYWTSESKDKKDAYLVSYNGKILLRRKNNGADYHGFRCVKNLKKS